jgi:drug/metabolite transporter (DMT)-like permease
LKSWLGQYYYLVLLQVVVIVFGFTGILGKVITVSSQQLVWHRMLIASAAIFIYILFRKKSLLMPRKGMAQCLLIGMLIAAHWCCFFESIKQSTVSIALAALSSASLFTALIEPLIYKRKLYGIELFLGALVILGLYFIYQYELNNSFGLLLGIIAAMLASVFTVLNGKMIKLYNAARISLYEMMGGVTGISIYLLLSGQSITFQMSSSDWFYLLLLGTICTAFAFLASVEVMKELTPFTVSLNINLEPIYGIVLALLIFGEEEAMSPGFYLGTALILLAIFTNIIYRRIRKRRAANAVLPS